MAVNHAQMTSQQKTTQQLLRKTALLHGRNRRGCGPDAPPTVSSTIALPWPLEMPLAVAMVMELQTLIAKPGHCESRLMWRALRALELCVTHHKGEVPARIYWGLFIPTWHVIRTVVATTKLDVPTKFGWCMRFGWKIFQDEVIFL